jgi:hypothetical protein
MVAGARGPVLIYVYFVMCALLFMFADILAGNGLPGFSPLVGWILTTVGVAMLLIGVRGMNHRS